MAERPLRKMKIGVNSLETDEGVAFVERKQVICAYPSGREFGVAMATDAEPPATQECRCGAEGLLRDEPTADDKGSTEPQHTRWDILLERRTEDELRELPRKRLKPLCAGKLRLHRHHG